MNFLVTVATLLAAFLAPVGAFVVHPRSGLVQRTTCLAPPLFLVSEVESTEDSSSQVAAASAEEEDDSSKKRSVSRDRFTAFVGNLPFDATEAAVKDLFAEFGELQLVSMPRNKVTGQFRGFAFVDLDTAETLDAAVSALDNMDLGGRNLRVSKSLPKDQVVKKEPRKKDVERPEMPEGYKKIYVGNIPFECTKGEIVELLSEYGEVGEVFLPRNFDTGSGRGFGFVTMKTEEADRAIEGANGMEFGSRKIVVSEPVPPGKRVERTYGDDGRTKVYVGNLSFYTVQDTIREIFEEFGKVHDCYMPEDPSTGGSRGFGFVTMDTDAAEEAIGELDGCEVDGRIVRVNAAQPKRGKGSRSKRDDDE